MGIGHGGNKLDDHYRRHILGPHHHHREETEHNFPYVQHDQGHLEEGEESVRGGASQKNQGQEGRHPWRQEKKS